ncbi:MAG: hypothetical protein HZA94_00850 [Candidatus Vogelbacteria bacterium]|nr:hypothetical protein [Candidatus Vogelbacteria bacterium]
MNRTEIEGRILSAIEVASSQGEAWSFIQEAIGGEHFQNLRIVWDDEYRCVDLRWFDALGMKHDLIVDCDKGGKKA